MKIDDEQEPTSNPNTKIQNQHRPTIPITQTSNHRYSPQTHQRKTLTTPASKLSNALPFTGSQLNTNHPQLVEPNSTTRLNLQTNREMIFHSTTSTLKIQRTTPNRTHCQPTSSTTPSTINRNSAASSQYQRNQSLAITASIDRKRSHP